MKNNNFIETQLNFKEAHNIKVNLTNLSIDPYFKFLFLTIILMIQAKS